MGITGLLPFLRNASSNVHVHDYSGCTMAIDAYCWLHKGAYSCSDKLFKGETTDAYVTYCVKRCQMLIANGVKPVMVFDGQSLPSKRDTETKRREARETSRKRARALLREGKLHEANKLYAQCVDVTSQMAHNVLAACRAIGVDCIVAPYEADAQLAYLSINGMADIVVSEDSDLMLFGCKRVIYKMDHNGNGVMVEKDKIELCLGPKSKYFTFEKFRYTCILSGCDYLPSLPGVGLGKAFKFFSVITNPDLRFVLPKVSSYLKLNVKVSPEYVEGFINANNTFLYQLVFCPKAKKLVPLNPYPRGLEPEQLEYAGKYFPDSVALKLAQGEIDFNTFELFPTVNGGKVKPSSIWNESYEAKPFTEVNRPIKVATKPKLNQNAVVKPTGLSEQDILSMCSDLDEPVAKKQRISPRKLTKSRFFKPVEAKLITIKPVVLDQIKLVETKVETGSLMDQIEQEYVKTEQKLDLKPDFGSLKEKLNHLRFTKTMVANIDAASTPATKSLFKPPTRNNPNNKKCSSLTQINLKRFMFQKS